MKARIKKTLTACAAVALFFPASAFSQEDAAGVDAAIAAIIAEGEADAEAAAPAGEPVAAGEAAVPDKAAVIDIVEAETSGDEAADEVDAILAEAGMAEAMTPAPAAIMSPDNAGAKGDGEKFVSMAFEDETLENVIRAFRDATGANIISGWTNEYTRPVNARLDNKEWLQGLNAIVTGYGLEVKEEPRGSQIYTVREKLSMDTELPRRVQTFELKHANAKDISAILGDTLGLAESTDSKAVTQYGAKSLTVPFPSKNMVVVKGTDDEIENCKSIIEALDKPAHQVYIEARFVRLSASASKQLGMKWDSLKDWGVSLENMRAGYMETSSDIGTYDYTATSASRSKPVDKDGKGGWKPERDYTIEKTTSTLVPEGYTAAPLAGLMEEDMTWKRASGYGGQLSIDGFRLAMSAFEQMDGVQIFSNPKIIVENETSALVDMTTKVPYIEIDYDAATADQRESIKSKLGIIPGKKELWVNEAFFSYGISLEVTPRVSPDGIISVSIVPSISELTGQKEVRLAEGLANTYPVIKVQTLKTQFSMSDGKTAVIGGLTETVENNVDSGIPLLRRIPGIGPRLFGWKSREKEQYEIIVFVTVGLADSATIGRDIEVDKGAGIGMPMNAVLGRGLLDGTLKEPGDRTEEEMFNLENKPAKGFRVK